MIGGQRQNIGDNSNAIQANGDVTINQGLTIPQMGEIMVQLQKLVGQFTAQAEETAQARFEKFQAEMLEKFADKSQANSEAFKDPDFQFLLRSAQVNYARDGNESTGKLLVELLAERSKLPQRDRVALILNEATDKISKLTDEDVSILSLAFVLLNTGGGCENYQTFVQHYKNAISPFIKDLKVESSSYTYMESLGCLSLNHLVSRSLLDIVNANYRELFTDGFTLKELTDSISDQTKHPQARNLVIPVNAANSAQFLNVSSFGQLIVNSSSVLPPSNTQSEKFRFRVLSTADLDKLLDQIGLSDPDKAAVKSLVNSKHWSPQFMTDKLSTDVPEYSNLNNMWAKINFQKVNLTSVGIALGHASLARTYPQFKAPLSIWIK